MVRWPAPAVVIPKVFVFTMNNVYAHPLREPPGSFVDGPWNPVYDAVTGTANNGNTNSSTTGILSLTGTRLADGRGLLIWLEGRDNHRTDFTGGVLRGAYTKDVYSFLSNNLIQPADIVTWDSTRYYKVGVRLFTDDAGDVYYSLCYLNTDADDTNRGNVKIWKANDQSDPLAGFSLYATIESNAIPGIGGTSFWQELAYPVAGRPYMMDNGRWVYVGGKWWYSSGQFVCYTGSWYSDDAGLTWTGPIINSGLGIYTNYIPGQIQRLTETGYLYCQNSFSSVSQNGDIWESQDDGETWTSVVSYGGQYNETPFWQMFDGSSAYPPEEGIWVLSLAQIIINPNIYAVGRLTESYLLAPYRVDQGITVPERVSWFNFSDGTISKTAKVEVF